MKKIRNLLLVFLSLVLMGGSFVTVSANEEDMGVSDSVQIELAEDLPLNDEIIIGEEENLEITGNHEEPVIEESPLMRGISTFSTSVEVANIAELKAAIAAAPTDGSETEIVLTADFSIGEVIPIGSGKNIRLVDNGAARTISLLAGAIPAFKVDAGGTLTISTSGNDSSLLVFNGLRLVNNTQTALVHSNGAVNWYGGTLQNSNFRSVAFSGSILISGTQASLHMTEGLIQGNQGGYLGGIITVNGGASFVMDGGTITENTATAYQLGSVVYINSHLSTPGNPTTFEMNGGTISNNVSSSGGGLFVGNTPFDTNFTATAIAEATINDGLITNNRASGGASQTDIGSGGAVFVSMAGRLTMNGGLISGNSADKMGGGVSVWDFWAGYYEDVYANAGYDTDAFFRNTWSVLFPAGFVMNGGTITGNEAKLTTNASGTGGGVYAGSSGVVLRAGEISSNKAAKQGGGVYVPSVPYRIQMSNVLVTENRAEIIGGGIWMCPTGDATTQLTSGGAFFKNTANEAADDIASIKRVDDWSLTVASRMLGGGRNVWYYDSAILLPPGTSLGNADPSVPRYPDAGERLEPIVNYTDNLALRNVPTEDSMNAARNSAKLYITDNESARGGGIGSNGSVYIGPENPFAEESIDVLVEKIWEDKDDIKGLRPEEISVTLLRDGLPIDSAVLNEENSWRYTFEDLPRYQDDNNEKPSIYTIEEDGKIMGYTSAITSGEATETGLSFIITNTIEIETTEISVSKVWMDNDNELGKRPQEIVIHLLQNGEPVDSITLSEDNEWSHVFTELPINNGEEAYVYTLEEEPVEGYTSEIVLTATGYVVTNTLSPVVDPVDPVDPKKPSKPTNTIKIPKTGSAPMVFMALGIAGIGLLGTVMGSRKKK